jgi:hypothetical protein
MTELLVNAVVGVLAALIGAAVIVVGWRVEHRRETERDRTAKRHDLRVQFLIDAYRRLEYVSNREPSPECAAEMERAIADIQLFGSPPHVAMAQSFATEFASKRTASLDSLLAQLRQSLRHELRLEPVPDRVLFLRMGSPPRFPDGGKLLQ